MCIRVYVFVCIRVYMCVCVCLCRSVCCHKPQKLRQKQNETDHREGITSDYLISTVLPVLISFPDHMEWNLATVDLCAVYILQQMI